MTFTFYLFLKKESILPSTSLCFMGTTNSIVAIGNVTWRVYYHVSQVRTKVTHLSANGNMKKKGNDLIKKYIFIQCLTIMNSTTLRILPNVNHREIS